MKENLRILFVEPFLGGSHQAFADGWKTNSRHHIEIIGLPAYKWKWRMRHAPVTLAQHANDLYDKQSPWDAIICSDMLALAEFKGLVGEPISTLPTVSYFHENQLTYPTSTGQVEQRDFHFAFSNLVSAITATENWFNSKFHFDSFFGQMKKWLKRMPDFQLLEELELAKAKSQVQYPGINRTDSVKSNPVQGALRILWPHRWEYDKNPKDFFEAMATLLTKVEFRLIVLGESFENCPTEFAQAKKHFADQIEHWGFVDSIDEFRRLVASCDIAVSTAHHEFFGMAMLEAASAGVVPVLPNRLAYPEIFQGNKPPGKNFFYDETVDGLAKSITSIDQRLRSKDSFDEIQQQLSSTIIGFTWKDRAATMDLRMCELVDANAS